MLFNKGLNHVWTRCVSFQVCFYKQSYKPWQVLTASRNQDAEVAKGKEKLLKTAAILDGHLKDNEYLLGDSYSLADTHVWSFVSFPVQYLGFDISSLPNVTAWMERVGSRPQLKGL